MSHHTHKTTLIDLAKQHGLFKKLVNSHQSVIETYEELCFSIKGLPQWRADALQYIVILKKNQQISLQNLRYCEEALEKAQLLIEGGNA